MIRSVLSDTLTVVFLCGMLLLVVALVLVFFLKEIPLRSSGDGKAKASEGLELDKKEPALS
ncbi:hypothetical protein D3C80_1571860 [compost metagenome]